MKRLGLTFLMVLLFGMGCLASSGNIASESLDVRLDVLPWAAIEITATELRLEVDPSNIDADETMVSSCGVTLLTNHPCKFTFESQGFNRAADLSKYISYGFREEGYNSFGPGETRTVFLVMNETSPSGVSIPLTFEATFAWDTEEEWYKLPWGEYLDTIIITAAAY